MKIHYTNNQSHKKLNLIPLLETEETIIFDEIHLSKTIFSGKKDSLYFYEKDENIFIFIGLGKNPDYKSLKTTFRRISAKQKSYFKEEAKLFLTGDFSNDYIEAMISGLWIGTYQLGHYKKDKTQHPLEAEDFIFEVNSYSDVKNAVEKGLKIANAQLETYHLVDLPPNKITPKHLADWAIEAGKNFGFSVEVFGQQKSKEVGLEAFVSVRGAAAAAGVEAIAGLAGGNAKTNNLPACIASASVRYRLSLLL